MGEDFVRYSSSCIVSLKYTSSVKGYMLTMRDGTTLRISQPRKKRFIQAFKDRHK